METMTEYEKQKRMLEDLQLRLEEAEQQIMDGEKLRKKLHNTILVMIILLNPHDPIEFVLFLRLLWCRSLKETFESFVEYVLYCPMNQELSLIQRVEKT